MCVPICRYLHFLFWNLTDYSPYFQLKIIEVEKFGQAVAVMNICHEIPLTATTQVSAFYSLIEYLQELLETMLSKVIHKHKNLSI